MLKRIRNLLNKIRSYRAEKKLLSTLRTEDQALIKAIKKENLTYLTVRKLESIANSCRSIETSKLPGIFLEAGCALGGSSILMASRKGRERPLFVYDVFGMIPPPTDEDTRDVHERYRTIVEGKSKGIGGERYYGYEDNLFDIVRANLNNFGVDCDKQSVSLIKGLVQDTMHIDQPVALAHVDVDWYEPVITCLERIFPNLISGGCIILDDYHDWGGCRKATDEYLQKIEGQFVLDDSSGSLKITKR